MLCKGAEVRASKKQVAAELGAGDPQPAAALRERDFGAYELLEDANYQRWDDERYWMRSLNCAAACFLNRLLVFSTESFTCRNFDVQFCVLPQRLGPGHSQHSQQAHTRR